MIEGESESEAVETSTVVENQYVSLCGLKLGGGGGFKSGNRGRRTMRRPDRH